MSTLDIKFTAIVDGEISDYYCYLCQIDGFNILLDCGWNFEMDGYLVDNFDKYYDNVDLILISGSSLKHVASLAYVYTKNSWKCPIYMTQPVWQASKMTMYDFYQALFNCTSNEHLPFTLDDIDNVWDSVTRVRYLQSVYLKGKGQGITVLALNSGMTLGSCMWRVCKDNEGEIVYAAEINHKKQLHLNEAMIHGLIKPFIFITKASDHTEESPNKKLKIQQLSNEILNILSSNNGSVLMFSDTAGQVIELLFLLSNILRTNKYTCIDVIICSHVAHHILKLVTSNTEWLNEKLMKRMEGGVFNFLGLLNLYTCQTIEEINHIKSARIVISSNINMEYPLGVQLFSRMAADQNNLIVYTIPPDRSSLAKKVIECTPSSEINFKISTRVQLEGRELMEAYDEIDRNHSNDELPLETSASSTDSEDNGISGNNFQISSYNNPQSPTQQIESGIPNIPSSTRLKHPVLSLNEDQFTHRYNKLTTINNPSIEYLSSVLEEDYLSSLCNPNCTLKPMQNYGNTRFKKSYNAYGETCKHEGFVKNVIQEKNIISYDDKMMKTAYDHAEIDVTKYPSKIVSSNFNHVQINARILFINLNCAIDCVSQTRMIESIQPRHLIILSSAAGDAPFLEKSLGKVGENAFAELNRYQIIVHRGTSNETLNICDRKQALYAKIKDDDIENLQFKNCSNVSIAWVEICDRYQPKNAFVDDHPVLKLLKPNEINKHNSIFINHVKINEFRCIIEREGIPTQIDKGVLCCADGQVKIFKTSANNIIIEAVLCQEYFEIKKLLYEQFCVL